MKLLSLIFIILFAFNIANTQAQNKTVDVPPFGFANTKTIEIRKVSLSEKETLLEVDAFFTPGYWIKIVSDTYLKAGDKKYRIRKGEGIVLDSLFWMPKSGEASFKLVFEPLPLKTEKFDFIESDCKDCFKIYDIDLSKKQSHKINIPKEFQQKHQVTKNFSVKWQKGKGLISGKIIGYKPDLGDVVCIYPNPITGNRDKNPVTISQDGTFKINTTIYSPTSLILRSDSFYIPLIVAPDKELKVLINLPEMQRKQSRLRRNIVSKTKGIYYAGFLADVNDDVYKISSEERENRVNIDSIANLGADALEKHFKQKYYKEIAKNKALKVNDLSRKILNSKAINELMDEINMMGYYLSKSYAKKYNISEKEAQVKYYSEPKRADFYDFYKEIPYNDSDILLSPIVSELVNDLLFFHIRGNGIFDIVSFLSESPRVTDVDRSLFKEFLKSIQNNTSFSKMKELEEVGMKYDDLVKEYNKKNQGIAALAEIWGTDKAFLLDLIKARNIANKFEAYEPLTEENKEEIKSFPIEIQKILIEENDKLLAKIEENKKKTGFSVLNVPQTSDEQLLVEMLKPFKGKVILIDVWATWCGPCLAANKQMEPLKAEFVDKDVVFLYLAGENSPEQTWKNMISDIKGQHYRVNKNQWNYLQKSFNARGVPTYIIVDKKGEHSYQVSGFPGVNTIKNELLKALEK
ncbi:TlpA family protein disulfide reductase [Capnocytophaga cynodegmi]|uniref:TlpA family protein disulfide reductase n=1 Tax=Capnocytophaga cynodegmi TaxID=28189 RepID=UPI00385AC0E9